MNQIFKAFCRIYQLAFRIAMPILPYREPKILESVVAAADVIADNGVKSVLLVTDRGLRGAGVTAGFEKSLAAAGVKCTVYDGTRANPTVHNVEEAKGLYVREGCEWIIAFGGGSSMDCAKAVGAMIAYPKRSLAQMKGLLRVLRSIPTLIAIPTTAGTGSEVTVTAVITDSEKRHKYTMNNFTFIPSYAVLDPEVTFTLPPALTATTGMDALTHAVEAYIGRSTTNETRRLATDAVRLIFGNIERAYADGSDREAREAMLRAAYMAGIAFSKSYVGYIHAVAHSLGGEYNIPHGLANSVLMPIVLEDYGACVYKKLHELGIAAGVCDATDTDAVGAEKFIRAIRELNVRMNIPSSLDGIIKEDIPKMARHAAREANPLYPVPKIMGASELERYYHFLVDNEY